MPQALARGRGSGRAACLLLRLCLLARGRGRTPDLGARTAGTAAPDNRRPSLPRAGGCLPSSRHLQLRLRCGRG